MDGKILVFEDPKSLCVTLGGGYTVHQCIYHFNILSSTILKGDSTTSDYFVSY